MKIKLEKLKEEFLKMLDTATNEENLEKLKIEFLGRKGKLKNLMSEMVSLADEERKVIGKIANEVKETFETAFLEKESALKMKALNVQADKEWMDITEPGKFPAIGHLHPITQAISEIADIFSRIGFDRFKAPEVDFDYYVFESLNMPKDHPARDDWETFFVDAPETAKGKIVLTPHTSNSQVRFMEANKPPVRMTNINRTYRRQSDNNHTQMFHQFEGLVVDKGITIVNLKGVLDYFAKTYFGANRKTRLRPHHFRFTEPSFEVDISCGICNTDENVACRLCKGGWIELGGAGMVHPNVLKAGGHDPEVYSGFAFGWGIERTLMMREGMNIDDMRILYKNDLRFVRQF